MQLSTEGQSDEEEEEEEAAAAAMEANDFRRETEFILQSENEGRNLAVMRAALASGKKVTTKDYIQKLESVPLDQIPESERSKSPNLARIPASTNSPQIAPFATKPLARKIPRG